jgi:alkanesulfonate monooxygenase SsuD/methylene tetrahydromethanopterin reductase-like flavin-dependent oxidoreductase (luciferase family)
MGFWVRPRPGTNTIRLGTAVIPVPVEQPLRLAEDAAVLDHLSGGWLELGLGKGFGEETFAAFGADITERNQLYDEKVVAIHRALRGKPVTEPGTRLYPDGRDLIGGCGRPPSTRARSRTRRRWGTGCC